MRAAIQVVETTNNDKKMIRTKENAVTTFIAQIVLLAGACTR
jgi:hypothetical protein